MDINAPIAPVQRSLMPEDREPRPGLANPYALIERSPVVHLIYAPDGRCIYANRAWEAFWGATRDQSRDYNILQDEQLRARGMLPLIERAFHGETSHLPDMHYDPTRSGFPGRPRWVRAHLFPVLSEDGAVAEVVQVVEDISDSRILMEALAQRDAQFRTVAEAIPHLVYTSDASGRGNFVNERWVEYTGISLAQAQGFGWLDSVHPDDRAHTLESWHQARAVGGAHETAFRLRRRDGVYRWHLARAWPMRDASGAITHWLGTLTDIQEQKQAEDRHRFLSDAGLILTASLDYQRIAADIAALTAHQFGGWCGIYHRADQGAPVLLAAADSALPGRFEGPAERPPDRARRGLSAVLADGCPQLWNEASGDSSRPESGLGVPLRARGRVFGALLVVAQTRRLCKNDFSLAQELADRLALTLDNAALYQQARESLRMRDDFIGVVSHELRTPLTSIRLQTQMTKRNICKGHPDALAPERMRILVEQTDRQVARLSRLVDEMLDLARINSGKLTIQLETFDLTELVVEVLERFADQLRASGCELEFDAAGPMVGCWDRYRLEQVITNLLTNAAKYGARRPVRVALRAQGDEAELSVSDQGMGIAAADQARIFEPFERAVSTDNISGLGLGLYIVRQILERLGGRIGVESESGRGATFIVRLPLRPRDADLADG